MSEYKGRVESYSREVLRKESQITELQGRIDTGDGCESILLLLPLPRSFSPCLTFSAAPFHPFARPGLSSLAPNPAPNSVPGRLTRVPGGSPRQRDLVLPPGRPKSSQGATRGSGIYDASGGRLLKYGSRPPASARKSAASTERKSSTETEIRSGQEQKSEQQRKTTILRKPTFREVEERLFPGRAGAGGGAGKGKLVKSQSLDLKSPDLKSQNLDSECRSSGMAGPPTGLGPRPLTPKWAENQTADKAAAGGGGPVHQGARQGRWLTRRAREVFLSQETFEERQEEGEQEGGGRELVTTPEPVKGNNKSKKFMKKPEFMKKFQR
jgi:hypothetical protein